MKVPVQACTLQLVNAALTHFMHRLDCPEPTARLPPELLCRIFRFLDLKDRILTSHVSKHWRAVSLAASSVLWNRVVARHPRPGMLHALLERSKDAPVHLMLTLGPDNVQDAAACLSKHMHHLQYLRLEFTDELDPRGDEQLSRALCTPAPMLETFMLLSGRGGFEFNDGRAIFSDDAPLLRLVKFQSDIDYFTSAGAFSRVRKLVYQAESFDLAYDLSELFAVFPNVEALSLEIDTNSNIDSASLVSFPASLTHFVLIADCPLDYTNTVLDFVRARKSNIRDLVVRAKGAYSGVPPQVVRQSLQAAASAGVTELACWSSGTQLIHVTVHMTTVHGQRHAFLDLPSRMVHWQGQWPPGIFESITVLRIGDNARSSVFAPSAPALVELEVMLLASAGAGFFDYVSALPSSTANFRLDCPSLRTLAIADRSGPSDVQRSLLDVESIKRFIEHQLVFSSDKLPRLALRGPRPYDMTSSAMTGLMIVVDCIAFEESAPALLADVQDILSWDY